MCKKVRREAMEMYTKSFDSMLCGIRIKNNIMKTIKVYDPWLLTTMYYTALYYCYYLKIFIICYQ